MKQSRYPLDLLVKCRKWRVWSFLQLSRRVITRVSWSRTWKRLLHKFRQRRIYKITGHRRAQYVKDRQTTVIARGVFASILDEQQIWDFGFCPEIFISFGSLVATFLRCLPHHSQSCSSLFLHEPNVQSLSLLMDPEYLIEIKILTEFTEVVYSPLTSRRAYGEPV